jgi:hydrogenase maturation protease
MTSVRVIGCGNPDAGDDALGPLAVRAARFRLPDDVEIVEARSGARVIDLLGGVDGVVLVDAVLSSPGSETLGSTIRLDASAGYVPASVRTSLSSHGLGLSEAVMLAASVGPLPRIVILGLEAHNTEVGSGLSPQVTAQLGALVRSIVEEVSVMMGVPVP